jgi:hypothetical protein
MAYEFCANCLHYDKSPILSKICLECIISRREKARFEPANETQAAGGMVDHPSHYNQGKYECIDVMVETFGKDATKNFCLLNAFKYVWRTGEKNGIEDIEKTVWYLEKYLELEGKNEQGCE